MGSPIRVARIRSTIFASKASRTASTTMNRLAAMQLCPELSIRPVTH